MYDAKKEIFVEKNRIKNLLSWSVGVPAGPVRIDAEIHRRCNLRCLVCPRQAAGFDLNAESAKNEMSLSKWLNIVNEAADLGVLSWNIEGACEPMYLPNLLLPVMEEVKKRSMFGDLTTNGTLWTEKMVRKTVNMRWDRVHISLDSVNAKLHDELRNTSGAFKKTYKTAMLFKRIKKHFNTDKPSIVINFVTNNRNYHELPEIIKLAHELGADYVFTEPVIVHTEKGSHLKLNKEQMEDLKNYINKAYKISKELDLGTNFASEEQVLHDELVQGTSKITDVLLKMKKMRDKKTEERIISSKSNVKISGTFEKNEQPKYQSNKFFSLCCYKPWFNVAIKFNGEVGPCGLLFSSKENIQNKSLRELWFGEYFKRARDEIYCDKLSVECSKCAPSDIVQCEKLRSELISHTDQRFLLEELITCMSDFINTSDYYNSLFAEQKLKVKKLSDRNTNTKVGKDD